MNDTIIFDIGYYPVGAYDIDDLQGICKYYEEVSHHKLVLLPDDIHVDTNVPIIELRKIQNMLTKIIKERNNDNDL